MKRLAIGCIVALGMVLGGAVSAQAGEVNGNGDPIPGAHRASSICAFSGQNDNPDDPFEGGRVQSYGQIVKAGFKAEVPSPGQVCRGNFVFPEE